jgi:hypothetical protein
MDLSGPSVCSRRCCSPSGGTRAMVLWAAHSWARPDRPRRRSTHFGQWALQPPRPSQAFFPAQSCDSGTAQPPRARQEFLPIQQSRGFAATLEEGTVAPGSAPADSGSLGGWFEAATPAVARATAWRCGASRQPRPAIANAASANACPLGAATLFTNRAHPGRCRCLPSDRFRRVRARRAAARDPRRAGTRASPTA